MSRIGLHIITVCLEMFRFNEYTVYVTEHEIQEIRNKLVLEISINGVEIYI